MVKPGPNETPVAGKDSAFSAGLGLQMNAADWVDQVRAEMEMEQLLGMLPDVSSVDVDAKLEGLFDMDTDMNSSLDQGINGWDSIGVF